MKLLVLADIDDSCWKHGSGSADVLLSCGDIVDQVILEAARAYGCRVVFAVKGNHDSPQAFREPIEDLHLRSRTHDGIRFGGYNGSWRYKPKGYYLHDQDEVQDALDAFPPVDVFLSHNSPRGIHDREDGVHLGFEGMAAYIRRTNPTIAIHGHQHMVGETVFGETRVIGVYGYGLIQI